MIRRDPGAVAAATYDLAVIGGGIHGVSVALEAALRGLSVVLIEKSDFGSGASANSLRILHGGLRYLQSLDLPRFRESVAERRWFARQFPALVEPLGCLMPLYGRGMKRRSVFRVALALNDRLSADRNDGVDRDVQLPGGAVLSAGELRARFSKVRADGLEGAAQWYDYRMRSSERVLIEMLHWACSLGVEALNYCEVQDILTDGPKVAGLAVADRVGRQTLEIRASKVCNCTGAGTRALAARYAAERRDLFVPSVAFNLLLDCEPLCESALAVAAPAAGSPVLFLCPAAGGLWAGTGHAGRPDGCVDPQVAESEVQGYLDQVNRAIPGINLGLRHVRKVYSGLLPVKTSGDTDLTAREVIVDHARQGGADGLYSVAGIKFTTARKVGERAVRKMFRVGADSRRKQAAPPPALTAATPLLLDGNKAMSVGFEQAARIVREVAAAESVVTPEDFLLRRTAWMFSMTDMAPLERLVRTAMAERAMS